MVWTSHQVGMNLVLYFFKLNMVLRGMGWGGWWEEGSGWGAHDTHG